MGQPDRDPTRPVYVISVAASIVSAHPRTLRIYEDEGLLCPARTATNIRLYSEEDVRRILWIRHLTQNRGVNLAGIRVLFELEERLGTRILETLFDEANAQDEANNPHHSQGSGRSHQPNRSHPRSATGRSAGINPNDSTHQVTVGHSSAGGRSRTRYRDQRTTDPRRRQGEPGNGQ